MRTTAEGPSGMAESRAGWPGCSDKARRGAAGSKGPVPGDFDPATHRSAARRARGRGGLLVGGLDFRVRSPQEAHGPGNNSSNGWKRQQRQALGSEGLSLSFMR